MAMFQESMDDLNDHLTRAEQQKTEWSAVGDIIIENLQEEIDKTKVDKPCPCIVTHLYWLLLWRNNLQILLMMVVLYRTVKVLKMFLLLEPVQRFEPNCTNLEIIVSSLYHQH